MKNLLLLLLLTLPLGAEALEAVVTVLEAPLLKEKSLDSKVVQYVRRGDVIKIHPSVANTKEYDHLAPSKEKLQELAEARAKLPATEKDPLFQGVDENATNIDDKFIPTLDRQGNTVYILSEHIYVYFNDSREFVQAQPGKDMTDYRLKEPLPKDYPLLQKTGYRGQFYVGTTQPYTESYPYLQSVKTKSYNSPLDFNYNYLRRFPRDEEDRFYIGANINLRTFDNTYSFFNENRISRERGLKVGAGPMASYDAYKGEKNRLNLFMNVSFYFFNQLNISQKTTDRTEDRNYRAYSVTPRLGIQYHRKQIFETLDFVLGTYIESELPANYKALNGSKETGWWRHLGEDSFRTRTTYSLAAFIGLQSAY